MYCSNETERRNFINNNFINNNFINNNNNNKLSTFFNDKMWGKAQH